MQITRNSRDTNPGPADWFTGTVYLDPIATPTEPSRVAGTITLAREAGLAGGNIEDYDGRELYDIDLAVDRIIAAREAAGPDFVLTARMESIHTGPSRFYYSTDRGHNWQGPFKLPDFGQKGIAARTDYLVDGKHELTMFLTAAR